MTTHANTPNSNERTPVRRAKTSAFGLVKATAGAIFFAAAIITFVWLPAEYGIDPTGVGQKLGLKEMGDIKNQLHIEADNAESKTVNTSEVSVETVAKVEETQQSANSATTTGSEAATQAQAVVATATDSEAETKAQAAVATATNSEAANKAQAAAATIKDSVATTTTADSKTATQALEAPTTIADSKTVTQALEATATTTESDAIAKILEAAANETKSQAANQAAETTTDTETATPVIAAATTATDADAAVSTSVEWRDVKEYRLSPGQAIEVKLTMDKGAVADFAWTANGAVVNHDTHGDGDGQEISYEKGRSVPSKTGQLTAAFKGSHGWFWRNRTSESVVITLRTRGDYETLYIP